VFRFNIEKTQELEAPISEVTLDPQQEQLVRDLAACVGPSLGLDQIPCRGLWLRAVRNWQLARGKLAVETSQQTPAARMKSALEIRDEFVLLARELLRSPDQRAALSAAIEDAFALYMKKYNKRR
jgi:hypothetical protein